MSQLPTPFVRPPPEQFHYAAPEEAALDEGIKTQCETINRSGWLWTVESCEGHWGDPFIRVVCAWPYLWHVLRLLQKACLKPDGALCCRVSIYPGYLQSPDWAEVLLYVLHDGKGLPCALGHFSRFAQLCLEEAPQ